MGILKWLWYFVYLQFLFVLGALAGLVVGGLFPSFFSCILIAKELVGPDGDYFATRRYVKIYRAVFWKSLQIGYLNAFVLLVCISNIIYFHELQGAASWALFVKLVWLTLTLVITATLTLVSPTFVNYNLSLRQLPRLILTGLGDFHSILAILFGAACLGLGLLYFTGVFLYIALGIFVFLVAFANMSFERRKIAFEREEARENHQTPCFTPS